MKPDETARLAEKARAEIHHTVQGQDEAISALLIALASQGHVLLEGIPGVGKTTLAKTFAKVTGLEFKRVQLTPDLMPTEITGHTYWDRGTNAFRIRQGPVFTNLLLADEINRTPPRTQAALLEVMQERQVTIEGETRAVPEPFLVVATKNPIEVEGVYNLPEAELDRFMLSVRIEYPPRQTESDMLDGKLRQPRPSQPVEGLADALQDAQARVRVHPDIRDYLLDIVTATREHADVELGASPRASEHLMAAARGNAVLEGRDYTVPDDVKATAQAVISHRLLLTADAEIQELRPHDVLQSILQRIPVPIAQGKTHA